MPSQSAPSSSSSSCCCVDGIASMEGGGGRWIFVSSSFSHTRTEEKSGAKRRENNFLGPRFTDSPKHSGVSLGRKLPKDVLTSHRIFVMGQCSKLVNSIPKASVDCNHDAAAMHSLHPTTLSPEIPFQSAERRRRRHSIRRKKRGKRNVQLRTNFFTRRKPDQRRKRMRDEG